MCFVGAEPPTLDLHIARPTAEEAVRRTEQWLRAQQVQRAGRVVVVTGRGKHSEGGASVLRPAVEQLLRRLKRRGVITRFEVDGDGALGVYLAPVTALFEAPERRRHPEPPPVVDPTAFSGLAPETLALLRTLATRSLEALGAPTAPRFVGDEMRRQFALLVPGLPETGDREEALRLVVQETLESLDE